MKKNKISILLPAATILMVFFSIPPVFSQDASSDGFIGRGIAKIVDGDTAGARAIAAMDAQKKVVLHAVCANLSVDEITKYFLTLDNLFFKRPDIYLQRFKIINENASFESYNIAIHGFVQNEILSHDLEAMGIFKASSRNLKVLLIVAEGGFDLPDKTLRWCFSKNKISSECKALKSLEKYFIEKGVLVLDSAEIPSNIFSGVSDLSREQDKEEAIRIAAELNADVLVFGKSELNKVEGQKFSSLARVQSNMSATAIDVRSKSVIAHTTTYALGINVDETSAALDAVDKSSRHISEQITDRMFLNIRNTHKYLLNMAFDGLISEPKAKQWLELFNDIFPEIEITGAERTEKQKKWSVNLNTTIESAAIVQRILEIGIEGYTTEVISATESVIDLRIKKLRDKT